MGRFEALPLTPKDLQRLNSMSAIVQALMILEMGRFKNISYF